MNQEPIKAGLRLSRISCLLLILVMLSGCQGISATRSTQGELSVDNIKQVKIKRYNRDIRKLDPIEDRAEIEKIVTNFNAAERVAHQYGTTHPLMILILQKTGDEIKIWGGTQGFQTVIKDGEQYNAEGAALDRYFKEIVKR